MVAYQSLYRRYRSQRFSELRGQPHVTSALKHAIETNSYGHAYLFSGPRGTGKTSTARILAKALNCDNVVDGEPCTECDSCVAIENNKSFDLHELDAASNNKVDDIRELIAKVHLGSPGRTKVYILDEVHMLSAGAENALLKTLEEPPDHVVFVLATTEPHKVVATIRSRTQHFTFNLLPAEELADHIRWVADDAGIDIDDAGIDYALRQGGGSARDTLSALDLVAAAGGVPAGSDVGLELTNAIGTGDASKAIAVIQEGLVNGQEPRIIGEAAVEVMRNAFLASMGAPLDHLHDTARETAGDLARSLGPATLTRAMEALGACLVEMRQAPDPRIPLEVAVLKLCRADGAAPASAGANANDGGSTAPAASTSAANGASDNGASDNGALAARVAELEATVAELRAALANGATASAAPAPAAAASASPPKTSGPRPTPAVAPAATTAADETRAEAPKPSGPAAGARARLAEVTGGDGTTKSRRGRNTGDDRSPSTPPAKPEPALTKATDPPPAEPEPERASPTPQPAAPAAPAAASSGDRLATGQVTAAWSDVLERVSKGTRARFKGHEVMAASDDGVTLGVPNPITADRCNDRKSEVEEALAAHFGRPLTLEIVVNGSAQAPSDPAKPAPQPVRTYDDDDVGPIDQLEDAVDASTSSIDRLTKAFPGSKVIEATPDQY